METKSEKEELVEKAKLQDLIFLAFVIIYITFLDDFVEHPHSVAILYGLISLFGILICIRGFAWFFPSILINGIPAYIIGACLILIGAVKMLYLYNLI